MPRHSVHGRVERKEKKSPQNARRALGRPQKAQEEGNSARIAANAPMSKKRAKSRVF